MMLFLANLFNRFGSYATMAGLFLGALLYSYSKGRRDSFNEAVRHTLEQETATRREADSIRNDVERAGDLDERVRRWTNQGR